MPPTFRAPGQRSRAERRQDDDRRRGSARSRGYDARWDRAAADFRRDHPLCLGCEAVGRIEATTVTDHVVPHKGDMVLFWDRTRWQPACGWHHDVVKQRLEAMYAAGEIGEEALRLDSPEAVRLTRALDGGGGSKV